MFELGWKNGALSKSLTDVLFFGTRQSETETLVNVLLRISFHVESYMINYVYFRK